MRGMSDNGYGDEQHLRCSEKKNTKWRKKEKHTRAEKTSKVFKRVFWQLRRRLNGSNRKNAVEQKEKTQLEHTAQHWNKSKC